MTKKDGLILVDIQNDFCPGGALAVNEGDQIVPGVNALMKRFDLTVITQDWHPERHISFASSHPGKAVFETAALSDGQIQTLWPDHCVQGTSGAELHRDLNQTGAAMILRKGRAVDCDSYSAFQDNRKDRLTGLGSWLKEQGIDRVFIAGLALDFCVLYSATDAAAQGFETWIVTDLCRAVDQSSEGMKKTLETIASRGIKTTTMGQILREKI